MSKIRLNGVAFVAQLIASGSVDITKNNNNNNRFFEKTCITVLGLLTTESKQPGQGLPWKTRSEKNLVQPATLKAEYLPYECLLYTATGIERELVTARLQANQSMTKKMSPSKDVCYSVESEENLRQCGKDSKGQNLSMKKPRCACEQLWAILAR